MILQGHKRSIWTTFPLGIRELSSGRISGIALLLGAQERLIPGQIGPGLGSQAAIRHTNLGVISTELIRGQATNLGWGLSVLRKGIHRPVIRSVSS